MEYPIDPEQVRKIAQSPTGQELIALLQRSGGQKLQNAIAQASAGDFDAAQSSLSGLLSSPDVQKLLRQLEGGK